MEQRPSRAAACPSENTLLRFAEGALAGQDLEEIELHLDSCTSCRELAGFAARTSGARPPAREVFTERLAAGASVGRYVIEGILGAGAMGVVYLAHDPKIDRKVALKLVRTDLAGTLAREDFSERLQREARALGRLSHPNVVVVHDVGAVGDQIFFAMDYVEGKTLSAWLRDKPRGHREVLDVFLQAGRGLAAAHAVGLVHRDFKPDNVLVGQDGVVRVSDFGLARLALPGAPDEAGPGASPPLVSAASEAGMVVGSPAYMSPEQMDGSAAGPSADVFSYCVALYEALFGVRPFAGRTLGELRQAIRRSELSPPQQGRRVPRWLRRVVQSGLQADPQRRCPTMAALLSALEAGRARPRKLALGAAAFALAATVGALAWRGRPAAVLCDARDQLNGTWDAKVRGQVERAFGSSGARDAAGVFARTAEALDGYASGLTAALTENCIDERFQRRGSDQLHELRRACLQDRTRELKSLTGLLANAQARVVEESVSAVGSLAPVESCAHPELASASRARTAALLGVKPEVAQDLAWKAAIAAELLRAELSGGGRLRLLPAQAVARTRLDLGLAQVRELDAIDLKRLRADVSADLALSGTLRKSNGAGLELEVIAQDAVSGEKLARVVASGSEDPTVLVAQAAQQLRRALGAGLIASLGVEGLRRSLPANPDAARLYAEGLAHRRASSLFAARDSLVAAAAIAPDSPQIQSELAEVYRQLGFSSRAKEAARLAYEHSASLRADERIAVEARHLLLDGHADKAVPLYRALFDFDPSSLESGLELARAQASAVLYKDALATLELLRRLPLPAGDSPEIDLQKAIIERSAGEYALTIEDSRRAEHAAEERGARTVLAMARATESWGHYKLGELEVAAATAQQAIRELPEGADPTVVQRAMTTGAAVTTARGELAEASRLGARIIDLARKLGDNSTLAYMLAQVSNVELSRGQSRKARDMLDEALTLGQEWASPLGAARIVLFLGEQQMDSGALMAAGKSFEWAAVRGAASGQTDVNLYVVIWRARLAFERDELEGARKFAAEALAGFSTRNEHYMISEAEIAEARIALEMRDWPQAEKLFRSALARAVPGERETDSDAVRASLARALFEQGRLREAREEIARAQRPDENEDRLLADVEVAKLTVALDGPAVRPQALRTIERAAAAAHEDGFALIELRARLAREELQPDAARLAVLEAQAHELGAERIARRAHALSARRER